MHAHTRGAKILVITGPWFSQAAEVADLVLPGTVDGLGPFDSVSSQRLRQSSHEWQAYSATSASGADHRTREAMS